MGDGVNAWACAALLLLPSPARSCAMAYSADAPGAQIDVLEEEALIVWEPEAQLEHFVRRASFSAGERDFGFLVPTPTRPELAEADAEVFERLERRARPALVTIPRPKLNLLIWEFVSLLSHPERLMATAQDLGVGGIRFRGAGAGDQASRRPRSGRAGGR